VCEFGPLAGNKLNIQVGVSLSSIEGARKNMETECTGKSFERISKEAADSWNKILSNIKVKGKNNEDKKIFYTALYHSCFLPVVQTDVDGIYPGLDRKDHIAKGYIHFDGFAFWDSFRTKYPLYSLFLPGVYADIVTSLRDLYEQADNWGSIPGSNHSPHGVIFKAAGKDGYQIFASCRHEHMLMVVADAYFKGIMNIDIKPVYPYMMKEVMLQMPEKYDTIGFIPARADQTGEYCWDNWVLARVASAIGHEKDYDYLMKRSEYWRNTWDSTIRFFRARAADGTWLDFPEDPAMNREKYTYEGSKWQWRWNVIHDVPSLIELFGGRDEFVKQLEYFFDNDLYTAGNQIDLQAPFLFNIAGSPWLTQKWVRKLLTQPVVQKYGTHNLFAEPKFDRIYKATPDGYLEEMDDDYGCMSSWYCMSAMGLYQVCPGYPVYQLTAPIFDKVTLKLDNLHYSGKKFTISAKNLSPENIYIQSATLNGKTWNTPNIKHDEITAGGELVYEMGPEPNKHWGN
jgi:predicted alpha-1,2-mannosidase